MRVACTVHTTGGSGESGMVCEGRGGGTAPHWVGEDHMLMRPGRGGERRAAAVDGTLRDVHSVKNENLADLSKIR